MHELDDDGAFTNAGGNTLHRTVADVTHDKDSWDVGLQQTGIAIEGPGSRALAIAEKVRAGEDEAALVALDEVAEPLGTGLRADENEEARRRKLVAFSGGLALHGDARQARFALD